MTPAEQEERLQARYGMIEDPQERLAAVMALGKKQLPFAPEEKTDAQRVPGCTSRVWLVGAVAEGKCRFRVEADSALVKGLAALLCAVYEGGTPADVAAHETQILARLRLEQQLSPTRAHGLQQVARALQAFGRAAA